MGVNLKPDSSTRLRHCDRSPCRDPRPLTTMTRTMSECAGLSLRPHSRHSNRNPGSPSMRMALTWLLCLSPFLLSALTLTARFEERERDVPAPAAVWPSGPLDLVTAFPRPVPPEVVRSTIGRFV